MKTKLSFSFKVKVIQEVLKGKLETSQAEGLLECSSRTLRRYKSKFMSEGPEGLKDKRHSNYQKLTKEQKFSLIQKKKEGPWRSARWIRDHLNLPVHEVTVWRTLGDLNHLNADQVKPIIRFEAQYPNELWQTDIMGKIYFPKIGSYLYLIASLDDYARFCLSGSWYQRQSKINVFFCCTRLYPIGDYQREYCKIKAASTGLPVRLVKQIISIMPGF